MVKQYYRNSQHKLEHIYWFTWFRGLKYARLVAEHLDTDHHEIILEEDFFNAPEVIQ